MKYGKLTLILALLLTSVAFTYAQNAQNNEETEAECIGEGAKSAEIAFDALNASVAEKDFNTIEEAELFYRDVEKNTFLLPKCKELLKRKTRVKFLSILRDSLLVAGRENEYAPAVEKVLWLQPEAQKFVSDLEENRLTAEINKLNTLSKEERKMKESDCQKNALLLSDAKKRISQLLMQKLLFSSFNPCQNFNEILHKSKEILADEILKKTLSHDAAKRLNFELADSLRFHTFLDFESGKNYLAQVTSETAFLGNEAKIIQEEVKTKIINDITGSPPSKIKIAELMSYTSSDAGKWLADATEIFLNMSKNDKDGYISANAFNIDKQKSFWYTLSREHHDPAEAQNLTYFVKGHSSFEGYHFQLYEQIDRYGTKMNEKIYQTYVIVDTLSENSFSVSFFKRKKLNAYSWKVSREDFVKVIFNHQDSLIRTEKGGSLELITEKDERLCEKKVSLKPLTHSKQVCLKMAVQFILLNYRKFFDE